jgi:GGDEF domain-containing protein
MKIKQASQYQDLVDLDDSLLALKDIESIAASDSVKQQYAKKYGQDLYSSILLNLTHEKYDNQEAELLWNEANTHLDNLTDRLGRNPGIAVAVLDYLVNIRGKLSEPVIIEEQKSEFISETTTKDQLTQLYLRRVFDITLLKEIHKSKRNKSHLSLLLIDIDDFKQVNDTLGHVQGDKVLSLIGKTLNQNIRDRKD